jgi:CheY-like chemotaxis protein
MRPLAGKRVLVLEDEPLIGIVLVDILEDAGCVVLGPAYDVPQALNLLTTDTVDCAVLDVNLGSGQTSAAVADALEERSIPFIFATGYGEGALRSKDRAKFRVDKPYDDFQICDTLRKCLERQPV